MVCQFLMYNKVNHLYINIYPHISSLLHLPPTLPIPPLQVVTKHRADLPVLCGCFPLASYFTFGSICKSMPPSHFVPAYPSPSPCPQVHSLRLHCLITFKFLKYFWLSHELLVHTLYFFLYVLVFLSYTNFLCIKNFHLCFLYVIQIISVHLPFNFGHNFTFVQKF